MARISKGDLDRRRADSLSLRLQGATYREIAARNFTSHETARSDVRLALDGIEDRNAVDRRRYRALVMLRLERLLRTWWAASIGCQCQSPCAGEPCPNPTTPDLDAADRILAILDAQARIMGLAAAPTPADGQGLTDDTG